MCIEKTCKTCINLCNKRGEVCNKYKGEVQEMIKEIDEKLTVEEAVRIIKEEGYMDFERTKIGEKMEVTDKVIRQFIDTDNNKYVIRRKPNGHYYLVKFEKNTGKTVAMRKKEIFIYLQEVYKQKGLKEIDKKLKEEI